MSVTPETGAASRPDRPVPPGSAPRGESDPPSTALDRALVDLVDSGTLTQEQAHAVTSAVATYAHPTAPEPVVLPVRVPGPVPEQGPGSDAPSGARARGGPATGSWRDRLLEAAVYLGAALVLAAVAIVVGQQWGAMSRGLQIGLVTALTAVGLVAGLAVGYPVRPRWRGPLDPAVAVRRRSASVILTATAGIASSVPAVVLDDDRFGPVAAAAAGLAVVLVAQVTAPSVLSELALFGTSLTLTGSAMNVFLPEPGPLQQDGWAARERVIALTLLALGATWAWGVSRALRHPLLAVSGGLGLSIVAAAMLQADGTTTAAALAMLAVAGATLITYLRDPAWPWVTATVVAATASVFLVAGDTLGPAVAFLVAGLALLGGVAVVVLLRRRRVRDLPPGTTADGPWPSD